MGVNTHCSVPCTFNNEVIAASSPVCTSAHPSLSPIWCSDCPPAAPARRLWHGRAFDPAGASGSPTCRFASPWEAYLAEVGPAGRSHWPAPLSTGAECLPLGLAAQSSSRRSEGVGESLLHPVSAASRGSGPRSRFPYCFVPVGPSHRSPVGSGATRPTASGPVDFCYVRLCCFAWRPPQSLA